jgi:hypothetical protein
MRQLLRFIPVGGNEFVFNGPGGKPLKKYPSFVQDGFMQGRDQRLSLPRFEAYERILYGHARGFA